MAPLSENDALLLAEDFAQFIFGLVGVDIEVQQREGQKFTVERVTRRAPRGRPPQRRRPGTYEENHDD